MNVAEKLNEVRELIKFRLYNVASKRVDALYEGWLNGTVKLTDKQQAMMFNYIDLISNIYCGKEF